MRNRSNKRDYSVNTSDTAAINNYLKTQQFCRFERLRGQRSIAMLYEKGNQLLAYPLKIIWRKVEAEDFPIKILFAVSKKSFPAAVRRNRIRRMMREWYRKNKSEIILYLLKKRMAVHLAIIYINKTEPDYAKIDQSMGAALKRLIHEIT